MDREAVYAFMRQQRLGVVSSVNAEGAPQSALVGIAVTPQLEIVFDTLSSTRKYRNLVGEPRCSFVVGWDGEQTVQLDGVARELRGEERERYLEIYFAAWPECRVHLEWAGIAHFVVKPTWIRYSDYDQRPPLIAEVEGLD